MILLILYTASPRLNLIGPIADTGPRILPVHHCLWNPWWYRDIITLHRGNRNNWPLLQRPPWFCYRPSQLCRIFRRSLIPSNAFFSIYLRQLRLGNQNPWLHLHLPPNYRKYTRPLSPPPKTHLTDQHTAKSRNLKRQNLPHPVYCAFPRRMGSLHGPKLPYFLRLGCWHQTCFILSTSLDP